LKPAIYAGTTDLIAQGKKNSQRQIVITGALDFTIDRLMDHLGIDDYRANCMEFVNGYSTGRIIPPVMASATKAQWIREYAEREHINLSDSYSYSDSISDLPMLSIVGHPVAVNPDIRLKQTALQHDWPILDLR
jgi:HAD superfamily hydrolase (TIGR01490 family)